MYWHKAKINIENVMILVALTYLRGLAWQGFLYIGFQEGILDCGLSMVFFDT